MLGGSIIWASDENVRSIHCGYPGLGSDLRRQSRCEHQLHAPAPRNAHEPSSDTRVRPFRPGWGCHGDVPDDARPRSRIQTIREFFEDDHVHMALIVAADGRLITTIERSDLAGVTSSTGCAAEVGTLVGRTVAPSQAIVAVTETLLTEGRRRLAVVNGSGRLLGLLCLKRDGRGFCSDDGIRARAEEAARAPAQGTDLT